MILLLLACTSGLDLGRADALAEGESRTSVGGQLSMMAATTGPETKVPIPWIQLSAGYHRGLGRGVEVGGRAWGMNLPLAFTSLGFAGDLKKELPARGAHVAIGGSAWYHRPALGGAPWHAGGVTVPLWIGVDLGPHQLVLTPRIDAFFVASQGMNTIGSGDVGLGVAMDLVQGEWHLAPEVLWTWSPIGFYGAIPDPDQRGVGTLQLGVSIAR